MATAEKHPRIAAPQPRHIDHPINERLTKKIDQVMLDTGIKGRSEALRSCIADAVVAAEATGKTPVLILGESGTGKEAIADIIYFYGNRRNKRRSATNSGFQKNPHSVNCAALHPDTLMSQLFGHKKNAFTGADDDYKGYFMQADGGVLFLDEVGILPMNAQQMLLRVLQEGKLRRVGATDDEPVDVRIIAATNRDLAAAVRGGAFLNDLYQRLSGNIIQMPPLRERGIDDIDLLARHFTKKCCDENGYMIADEEPGIAFNTTQNPKLNDVLQNYSWPGNIRELDNVIHRAVALIVRNAYGIKWHSLDKPLYITDDVLQTAINQGHAGNLDQPLPGTIDIFGANSLGHESLILVQKLIPAFQTITTRLQQLEQRIDKLESGMHGSDKVIPHVIASTGEILPVSDPLVPTLTTAGGSNSKPAVTPTVADVDTNEVSVDEATFEDIGDHAPKSFDDLKREALTDALVRNGGNRRKAAEDLGLSDRTVYRKIKQYGIKIGKR